MGRLTHFDGISYQPLSSKVECVQKLGLIEDAEEQGRLVAVPCKVGDTVYWISNFSNGIHEGIVMGIEFNKFGIDLRISQSKENHLYVRREFEKVFLTREEAEQALKVSNP